MGTGKLKKQLMLALLLPLLLVLLSSGIFQAREAQILVGPEELVPGSPVSVIVAIPEFSADTENQAIPFATGELIPLRALLISLQNKTIQSAPFFYFDRISPDGTGYILAAAILVIPNTLESKEVFLEVQREKTAGTEAPLFSSLTLPERQLLAIRARNFNTETIALGQQNTDIKTKPDPQKTTEAAELWKLLTTNSPGLYTTGGFAAPVESNRRTSFYGDRRVYQYTNGSSERSIHGGIDFGIPRGTIVRACAPGLVRMARFRIVTGNTVILQHAPGVYSVYYHMDSLSVTEGTQVAGGTELGKSGSTGLSTGPHLHWEFRIQGEFADPDLMVTVAPLDKDRIISKIAEKLSKHTDRSAEGR